MAKSMKLGGGGRFAALKRKVGSGALAAWIGRKKYGPKKMASMSSAGRKRAAPKPAAKAGGSHMSAMQKIQKGLHR